MAEYRNLEQHERYVHLAIQFAEKYGVVQYSVRTHYMSFYVNSLVDVRTNTYATYKHTVDLDTMHETVTKMKVLKREGFYNRR